MATDGDSTTETNSGLSTAQKDFLELFYSRPPEEQDAFLAERDPQLAANNKLRREGLLGCTSKSNSSKVQKTYSQPASATERLKRELIVLNFIPYDVVRALDDLRAMVLTGEVTGLVFAVSMRGEKPYMFGASGRLKDNTMEAIGASTLLQRKCMEKMQ